MRRWALALGLFCLIESAWADDGWWLTAGGFEHHGKGHSSISMVSEDLRISIHGLMRGNIYRYLLVPGFASVKVDFVFKNFGPATTVEMGFPEEYQMRVGGSVDNFRTWVDGRRAHTRHKILTTGDPIGSDDYSDSHGTAVWLKRVSFGAYQTRKVRVTYETGLSGNTSDDRSLQYELQTGSTWHGPIGRCHIVVTWPRIVKGGPYFHSEQSEWKLSSGRAELTKLRWKPKQSLVADFQAGALLIRLNGIPIESAPSGWQLRGSLKDPELDSGDLIDIFGHREDVDGDRPRPVWGSAVGGPITEFHGYLSTEEGPMKKLRRGSRRIHREDGNGQVYLRDVVEALGGRMTYNKALSSLDIWLPPRAR